MLLTVLSGIARVRLTVAYATALAGVAVVVIVLGPDMQDRLVRAASTNLDNLRHGRLATLLGSAFVSDAGPVYLWLPGLVCLLVLAELLWCSRRLALVFLTGHVGATLLVAVGLATAVRLGWLPRSVGFAHDVGMSYGAAAVLGALSAAIPPRWRPAWVGWWVAVAATVAAVGVEFSDTGHVVALGLGMLVALRLDGPARWTPTRCALLAVALPFGFVVLAHTAVAVPAGIGLGAAGAFCGHRAARYRATCRPAVNAAR